MYPLCCISPTCVVCPSLSGRLYAYGGSLQVYSWKISAVAAETVAIRSDVVNRSRLARGLARMELYKRVGCDPRTGIKFLNGGCVRIDVACRLAEVLGLPIARVIDLSKYESVTGATKA